MNCERCTLSYGDPYCTLTNYHSGNPLYVNESCPYKKFVSTSVADYYVCPKTKRPPQGGPLYGRG